MEETNFVLLWKEHYEKIDRLLAINQKLLKETISLKAQSALQPLIKLKTRGIVALVVYLVLLGTMLFYAISHYSSAVNYFILSISIIFLINLRALYDYIKHLIWTNNINYDGSVTEIQLKLSKLQLSIINHEKIMCLQFPFYTTFYLTNKWFPQEVGVGYIIFQILITGSFIYGSYWLYKNNTIENLQKKWFRNIIAGSGNNSVLKALDFYKELENFKQTS